MRKFILLLGTLILTSFSQVQAGSNQLFDCVDATTLEIDSKCVESKFEQNNTFVKMQDQFFEQQAFTGGNVIATLIFDEKKMQIDVIVHRDAIDADDLYVANDPLNH